MGRFRRCDLAVHSMLLGWVLSVYSLNSCPVLFLLHAVVKDISSQNSFSDTKSATCCQTSIPRWALTLLEPFSPHKLSSVSCFGHFYHSNRKVANASDMELEVALSSHYQCHLPRSGRAISALDPSACQLVPDKNCRQSVP